VLLPATLVTKPPEEPMQATVPFVKDLCDALRTAHLRVCEATKSVARTEKQYYDERSRKTKFVQGQLVWLFWPKPPVRQQYRKLQQLWTGPWCIEKFKTPLVVELKHTSKRTKQVVHVDRLLPYSTPPPPTDIQDDGQTDSQTMEPLPGPSQAFDEPTCETRDTQDMDSQLLDSDLLASQRPKRTRRQPAALEPYILT